MPSLSSPRSPPPMHSVTMAFHPADKDPAPAPPEPAAQKAPRRYSLLSRLLIKRRKDVCQDHLNVLFCLVNGRARGGGGGGTAPAWPVGNKGLGASLTKPPLTPVAPQHACPPQPHGSPRGGTGEQRRRVVVQPTAPDPSLRVGRRCAAPPRPKSKRVPSAAIPFGRSPPPPPPPPVPAAPPTALARRQHRQRQQQRRLGSSSGDDTRRYVDILSPSRPFRAAGASASSSPPPPQTQRRPQAQRRPYSALLPVLEEMLGVCGPTLTNA